ncbi:MAG: hypothetical protein FJ398_05015 [Verrucomicrobia bacterium]|nr:hypothetical protein [Verrucomicrobiota bacterium]
MGCEPESETKGTSHEPDGRASLSPASRVGRVPRTSSGSPGRTRPTGFMGRVHGSETKGTCHEPDSTTDDTDDTDKTASASAKSVESVVKKI